MKRKYETPEVDVLKLSVEDVIATSGGLKDQSTWVPKENGDGSWGSLWN